MDAPDSHPTADVRERILRAATRLFAARGFDGASLADIAGEVGVTKAALLYHFRSKDDLRRAVLAELLDRWNDVLPRLLMAATSPEGQFAAVVDETLRFLADNPDRARVLLREVLDRPDEMGELIDRHVRPWVSVICDYIRKGQAQGTVHADVYPEAYVAVCMNAVLATVATMDTMRALGPEPAGARDALIAEALRVAKVSLFRPDTGERAGK
ncbi:MAG: TetR/AcrR family transcriptional regulator [Deltaproteobacteria bacterium]|nr:MAG: TetR/AcrR family transcriptional regulator [Deltaproteobacteria bacterium]